MNARRSSHGSILLLALISIACGDGSGRLPAGAPRASLAMATSQGGASTAADPRVQAVDALVTPLLDRAWLPGLAIALIDSGGPSFYAYGAIQPGGAPVDRDTLFEIGSITKLFTAMLLQDMVERGEVSLGDTVASLLPRGIKLPAHGGEAITLLDLATHFSGLPAMPSNFAPDRPDNPYVDYDERRLYEFLADAVLATAPGESFHYSNLGFGLLGHALALHAGRAYEELVRDRISGPLGMSATSLVVPNAERARLARGQDADGQAREPWDFGVLAPAVGLHSSLFDMARFALAALAVEQSPLTHAFSETTKPVREIPRGEIGLAWLITPPDLAWHNGETGGHCGYLGVDRAHQVGVVVLASAANPIVDELAAAMLQLMRGERPDPIVVPDTIAIDAAALDDYPGHYLLDPDSAIDVWRDADSLRGSTTERPTFRLWPSARDAFYARPLLANIEFERDLDGKVVALNLVRRNMRLRAVRE